MPLAVLAYELLPDFKRGSYAIALAILIPLLIEATQALLNRGICDIDDIILNGCGWMLGYGIMSVISMHKKSPG